MRARERIRNWRKNRGMTQSELAEELGVTFSMISKWERGEDRVPEWVRTRMRQSRERNDILTEFGARFDEVKGRNGCQKREAGRLRETIRGMWNSGAYRTHGDLARALDVCKMTVWRHLNR